MFFASNQKFLDLPHDWFILWFSEFNNKLGKHLNQNKSFTNRMAKNESGTWAKWLTVLVICHWRRPPSPANAIEPPPEKSNKMSKINYHKLLNKMIKYIIKINYHKLITKNWKKEFSNHHIKKKKINHFMSNNANQICKSKKGWWDITFNPLTPRSD